MKKTILYLLILLPLTSNAYSQDSLKTTLGVGLSVNKYWFATFENYAINVGKYVNKNREFGINCRYFQSSGKEPGRLTPQNYSYNFFQFQSNIYMKNHEKIFDRNIYSFAELGIHYTNSVARNFEEFSFSTHPSSYILPNFSLGLGTDFYIGEKRKFAFDTNVFLSNGKVRTEGGGIRELLAGSFFIVGNIALTGKVMF